VRAFGFLSVSFPPSLSSFLPFPSLFVCCHTTYSFVLFPPPFLLPSFLSLVSFILSGQVGGHHFGVLSHGYGPDAIVVKVPVRCVGTLMGSRGSKMKEIKEKTGARVTLSKVGGGGGEGGRGGEMVVCCLC